MPQTKTKDVKDVIYALSWEIVLCTGFSSSLAASDYPAPRSEHYLANSYFKIMNKVRGSLEKLKTLS